MKTTAIYFRYMVWVYLLVLSVGCSYHASDYTTKEQSPTQPSTAHCPTAPHPFTCNDPSETLNSLLLKFKQCCSYIYGHKTDYTHEAIINLDAMFRKAQYKTNIQQRELMSHHKISATDNSRITKNQVEELRMGKVAYNTLRAIFFVKYWKKAASGRLKALKPKLEQLQKLLDAIATRQNSQTKCAYCCNKQKHCNCVTLYYDLVETLSNSFTDYLYGDLLAYWGKVVELCLFHALNTSFAQGKIGHAEAELKYTVACKATEQVYRTRYIEDWHKRFMDDFYDAITHRSAQNGNNLKKKEKEVMHKLNKYILAPIENMYKEVSMIIREIKYSGDAKLKKKVMGSLELFYNIAYAFAIIDLIYGFSSLILVYNASDQAQAEVLATIVRKGMQWVIAQVWVANFIEGNEATLSEPPCFLEP